MFHSMTSEMGALPHTPARSAAKASLKENRWRGSIKIVAASRTAMAIQG
jgi:hypothetical protein